MSKLTPVEGHKAIGPEIASLIDHTLLKADATPADIEQLCLEAREYGFAAVCINPTNVPLAARLLKGSPVAVCTVVGFPLGATMSQVKAYEAREAIRQGATEIDMVLNIGALKAGDHPLVKDDIRQVVKACREGKAICKIIIEAALLTDEEKVTACQLAKEAGADYVKTSTGFGPGGATEHDVALMHAAVGSDLGVKAAGSIKSFEKAASMVQAGATRIGASAGIQIVKEAHQDG